MVSRRLSLTALLILVSQFGWASPGSDEVRGLWITRLSLNSPESIDRLVDDAARAGFNTLIVQVRGRGDALYRSAFEPRSELLKGQPGSFDPLEYTLKLARRRGLKVHAWFNTLLVHSAAGALPRSSHVLARHPEWVLTPRSLAASACSGQANSPRFLSRLGRLIRRQNSEVEGFYLDPADPAVRDYLVGLCVDLLRGYELDGLHLDYIRYPNQNYGFGRAALNAFADRVDRKLSPQERSRMRRAFLKQPLYYAHLYPEDWNSFRREQVTELLAQIGGASRRVRSDLILSAAVTGNQSVAFEQKLQDWRTWMRQGLLHAVCPMAYVVDTRSFRNQVIEARRCGSEVQVWAGIGAWQLPVESTLEKIQVTRSIGVEGFVLFSYGNLAKATRRDEGALARLGDFLRDPTD